MKYDVNGPKTVLVTGGAGFIGSCFARRLARHKHVRVIVLDALTYAGSIDNLEGAGVEFVYGNILDSRLVDDIVSEVDYVVHFAAETHVTRSIQSANRQFFETDVLGTQTIANACLQHRGRVSRLLHVSSSEVYGSCGPDEIMSEDYRLEPMSPYAAAKAGADRLVASYCHTYGLPFTIARPFNNYGPQQHVEKMIPKFITAMMARKPVTVHGEGTAARDFVYVEDTCEALEVLMWAPEALVDGEVYNIASGTARTISEVAADLRRPVTGGAAQVIHVPDRPGQVHRHCGSSAKIFSKFGWSPATTWERGLDLTATWFRSNKDRWRRQLWAQHAQIVLADGSTERH